MGNSKNESKLLIGEFAVRVLFSVHWEDCFLWLVKKVDTDDFRIDGHYAGMDLLEKS